MSNIRTATHHVVPDPSIVSLCTAVFEDFVPVSITDLSKTVQGLRYSVCSLDSLPAKLFKDVFETIGPFVLSLINMSLSAGYVPVAFKKAIVQPLLKKHNLDPSVLSNYRPVSKLPFLSKVLEKVVYAQLQSHLSLNKICDKFQSGFKSGHSTETALLKVFNDLLLISDAGRSAVLVLLDLTAAFDTVDHKILLSRLESCVGIKGTVLNWFRSYLSERSFTVNLGPFNSKSAPITSGVPQGSILGPVLFSLYMLPLGSIFQKYNISYHCFADDVQIYLPLNTKTNSVEVLRNCLGEVKDWMSLNFLNLNNDKTEVIIFGDADISGLDAFGPTFSNCCSYVKSLGVLIDSTFKLDRQISSVVKSSFFQLRLLRKVKPYLPHSQLEKVVHALITNRLDYCNSLYYGLDQGSIRRLQLVQNAAARLLTGKKRNEHITPILSTLHWLPVVFRIHFKILLFVYKSLNGLAPLYLSDMLTLHTPSRTLRSTGQLSLDCPRSRRKTRGDRAFSIAGPTLWNSLPPYIRAATSVECFKSLLKTHLFASAFES